MALLWNLDSIGASMGGGGLRVTVVTPTLGELTLAQAALSVQMQTAPVLRHLVVIDGPDGAEAARTALEAVSEDCAPRAVVTLPYRVGDRVTFGHKIYGAAAYLSPEETEVVCFLDADNWYEPDHVERLLRSLSAPNVSWAYTLRRVVDKDGLPVCRDDCDSLGHWEREIVGQVGTGMLTPGEDSFFRTYRHHIDTNCYAIPVVLLRQVSPQLACGPRGDSRLACQLLAREPGSSTRRYTVNYRLGSESSGTAAYFRAGNTRMRARHPRGLPWTDES